MLRDVKIEGVLNGFIVRVGCQTIVFNDPAELAKEIERYLKNPDAVEKEYVTKSINAKHFPGQPQLVGQSVGCAAPGSLYTTSESPIAGISLGSGAGSR